MACPLQHEYNVRTALGNTMHAAKKPRLRANKATEARTSDVEPEVGHWAPAVDTGQSRGHKDVEFAQDAAEEHASPSSHTPLPHSAGMYKHNSARAPDRFETLAGRNTDSKCTSTWLIIRAQREPLVWMSTGRLHGLR